jgi:hypothetical protein
MSINEPTLDALSEMVALSSYGNTKNLLVTAIETRGPLDREAMERAFQEAGEQFPQMKSCLKETRDRGMFRLERRFQPDLPLQVIYADLERGHESVPVLDLYLNHMAPRLDRDWNLFEELPAEFHFLRLSENHHVLAPVIHHVAADAGVASEFGRQCLANYHRLVTGSEPEWGGGTPALSTSSKKRVVQKAAPWTKLFSDGRKAIANLMERPTLPLGNGVGNDLRQFHVKRVLSPEDSALLAQTAARHRASLVDLLTAAANVAIDRWNGQRNQPPGKLTTAVSVNMKGRFQGMDRPNNSAQMYFKSLPEQRTDPAEFLRSIGLQRIKQLRRQLDLTFFEDVSRMNASVRLLPFPLRRKVVHFLTNRHQFSTGVTLIGVVWPVFKNGRATGETSFTRAGDLDITDVHGIGYKLLSSTRLLFIAYGFNSRLNIMLAVSACLFTREEADAFLDVTIDNLLTYANNIHAAR